MHSRIRHLFENQAQCSNYSYTLCHYSIQAFQEMLWWFLTVNQQWLLNVFKPRIRFLNILKTNFNGFLTENEILFETKPWRGSWVDLPGRPRRPGRQGQRSKLVLAFPVLGTPSGGTPGCTPAPPNRTGRSIEVCIPACHAGDPGSIPGGRNSCPGWEGMSDAFCRSRGSMEERWTSDPTVAGSSPAAIVVCRGKAP